MFKLSAQAFIIILSIISFFLFGCDGFRMLRQPPPSPLVALTRDRDVNVNNKMHTIYQAISSSHRCYHRDCGVAAAAVSRSGLRMVAEIVEFEESASLPDETDTRTDEEKMLTHGYEGKFKVGDVVRVTKSMRLFHVKQYAKEGFDPVGMTGTVVQLVLYGRKRKSLCSAITPVKVEFAVDGEGVPAAMFEKKWQAHLSGEELELVHRS